MPEQSTVDEKSTLGQLIADLKVPSGNAFGLPQQRQYPPRSALFDNRATAVDAERRF